MPDIEVSIVDKIRVNEDGKHCGKECAMLSRCTVMNAKTCFFDHSVLPVVWHEEWQEYDDPERTDTCLAAQKEAEGGIYPQDMPILGNRYAVENKERDGQQDFIATATKTAWEHCQDVLCQLTTFQDGDRFYPVPKEKE